MSKDEISIIVSWKPINGDTKSSGFSKLRKIDDKRIDFTPTYAFIIFSLFFLLSGIILLILRMYGLYSQEDPVIWIIGTLFSLVGIYLLFLQKNYISIRNLNGKWILLKNRLFSSSALNLKSKYKDIHAIQIIEKKDSDSYQCYELNMVYTDGSRDNIIYVNRNINQFITALTF